MAPSKPPKQRVQPVFDSRGRLQLERRGLPRSVGSTLQNDAYHFLRTAGWGAITLLFAGMFLSVNLIFAVILYVGHADILNATGFADCFWFSVQTVATVGYGYLAPHDTFANAIVTVESFVTIGMTAVVTGVFFARFSTPSARVIFSRTAIIADYDGKRTLMFRMANARATAIVEATAHVYTTRDEQLSSGERVRRIYDLPLRRQTSPVFNLSWTAYHQIDEQSPLWGVTPEELASKNMNVVITFTGIDDSLAATVHTRYAYNASDIELDREYVDIFKDDHERGVRYLDFDAFHDTREMPTSAERAAAVSGRLPRVPYPAGPAGPG